jgi:competence ComEA-like helix-hairpin-helix protein
VNAALWLLGAALSCLLFGAVAKAEPSSVGTPAPAEAAALIDLNHASVAELTSLPGIGEKRAEAILAFRDSHGGFQSVTQLLRIKGIGRAMLRKLRLLVTVSSELVGAKDAALTEAKPVRTGSRDIHRVR